MWSFRPGVNMPNQLLMAVLIAVAAMVSGCTVEPLNASRPGGQLSAGSFGLTTREALSRVGIKQVNTRQAQQVRNQLLFAFHGGQEPDTTDYDVTLVVLSRVVRLSVEANNLSPTSAQVIMRVNYTLVDKKTGKEIDAGVRETIAAFDRTPQSFANQRAERDAENRAAKTAAHQISLAIAQAIADT